jgi:hypothetical protein
MISFHVGSYFAILPSMLMLPLYCGIVGLSEYLFLSRFRIRKDSFMLTYNCTNWLRREWTSRLLDTMPGLTFCKLSNVQCHSHIDRHSELPVIVNTDPQSSISSN